MRYFTAALPTPELLDGFKANCALMGCKVRTRKLDGSLRNAVRVVLLSGSWDQLRDAAVLSNLVTSTMTSFTDPKCRLSWDGSQVNVFFPA